MKKQNKWAVYNKKTGKVAWLNRGSKRRAVFNTRKEARNAYRWGETCSQGVVARLTTS